MNLFLLSFLVISSTVYAAKHDFSKSGPNFCSVMNNKVYECDGTVRPLSADEKRRMNEADVKRQDEWKNRPDLRELEVGKDDIRSGKGLVWRTPDGENAIGSGKGKDGKDLNISNGLNDKYPPSWPKKDNGKNNWKKASRTLSKKDTIKLNDFTWGGGIKWNFPGSSGDYKFGDWKNNNGRNNQNWNNGNNQGWNWPFSHSEDNKDGSKNGRPGQIGKNNNPSLQPMIDERMSDKGKGKQLYID
jgi:hypothetical protein